MARRRATQELSGEGAFQWGGRWNLPGTRVIYCAESRALAALELLVHVEDMEDLSALDWRAVAVDIPGDAIECPSRYLDNWQSYPYRPSTQEFGSEWSRARRSVALRVPSAVVPGEFNYLLNPGHPGFGHLRVAPPVAFRFDRRLRS